MAKGPARRRTPGSGYTRQEKNGSYTALYPKQHAAGYHVKRGFPTETAAERWLASLAKRQSERFDIAGGEQILNALIDRWLDRREEDVQRGSLKEKTWIDYDYKLGYARDLLGDRRISEIMPDHIDDALRIIGRSLAETTTRQIRALLHRILEDAYKRHYITSNPVIIERSQAAVKQAPIRLNARDARALLGAARGSFYELAWWLILTLGLRAGEVLGLRRGDIDRDACTILIEHTIADVRGKAKDSTPKTKAGRRTLPFPRALLPMLDQHIAWLDKREKDARRKQELYESGPQRGVIHRHMPGEWKESELLFPGRGGRAMNTTSLYHQLQRLCDTAHVPRTKVHNLRHTAAKFYTDLHIEERYIKAVLGHVPNITGHYAAVDAEAMRGWVERVYKLLSNGAEKAQISA